MPLAPTVPSRSSAMAYGRPGDGEALPDVAVAALGEDLDRQRRLAAQRVDGGLEGAADVTALGAEDGEEELGPGPGREAVDQPDPAADLRALVADLERGRGTEAKPQHPDLAGEREDGQRQRRAGGQRDDKAEGEPAVGAQRFGEGRGHGEGDGEESVAGHGEPADLGGAAEAGAGGARLPLHQRAEQRQREQGHQRGGGIGRLIAAEGDAGRERQLGSGHETDGAPAKRGGREPEGPHRRRRA